MTPSENNNPDNTPFTETPKLRSPFLGVDNTDAASTDQTSPGNCPACGNELPPGSHLRCGCGWSPKARQALFRKALGALFVIAFAISGSWLMSNYYQLFPDDRGANIFVKEGDDFYHQGKVSEAYHSYSNAISVSPKRADIRYKLSVLLSQDQPNAAFDEARKTIELEPDNFNYVQNYVQLAESLYLPEEMIQPLERLLKSHPKDIRIYLQLAAAYKRVNKPDKTLELYEKATKIDKHGDVTWSSIASIYAEQGKTKEAIQTLKQGISSNPDSAVLHYQLGNIYAKTKNPDALVHLKKAAEMDPYYTSAVSPLIEQASKKKGKTEHLIRLYRHGNNFLVEAVVNNQFHTWLTLDTGANICVIPTRIARQAKADLSKTRRINMTSVTGHASVPLVAIKSLKIGNAEVKNVLAVVHDMPGQHTSEGLLGISYLEHFHVTLDTKRQQLILKER